MPPIDLEDEDLQNAPALGTDADSVQADEGAASSIRQSLEAAYQAGGQDDGTEPASPGAKPKDATPPGTAEPVRDEKGRFAPKEASADPTAPAPGTPPAPIAATTAQPQPALAPPGGWNAEAKAAFATLPPSVQQAVAQREQEVNQGFQVLQQYKGLERHTERLRSANVTFADTMDRFLAVEDSLKQNAPATLMMLMDMVGIDAQKFATAILGGYKERPQLDLARGQAGWQPPRPGQAPQPAAAPQALTREQLRSELAQIEQEKTVTGQVEAFFADPGNVFLHGDGADPSTPANRRAALVSQLMVEEIGKGADLPTAYARAVALWQGTPAQAPANQTAQPQAPSPQAKHEAAIKARQASRSIAGPTPAGASPAPGGKAQDTSTRALLEKAFSSGSV